MDYRDLIVTPLLIMLVYVVAYNIRPYVTDAVTIRYFLPALTMRIIGALAVGFIYQFYYNGGDTFSYHTHGSRHLWEAIMESPGTGFRAMFQNGEYGPGLWRIAEDIWYWRDPQSFFVIRIAALFDLITFSSYSGTAVLFAVLAFTGSWMMFLVFYRTHPAAHRLVALCCLFIPSVIFWGSGILKDTVTLAFLGVSTFCVYQLAFEKKLSLKYLILLMLSFYVIYSVKKYILISLLAAIVVWVASRYFFRVRSVMLRVLLVPVSFIFCTLLTYYSVNKVMEDDPRYSLDKLAQTSMITAHDIRYGWGARAGEGSGYSLGVLDGTWQSILRLAPGAVNVALFRPYLWEVTNPLMAMSAIESLATLFFTLVVLIRVRGGIIRHLNSEIIFCLVFSLIFALGVGISTFNFGSLSRYKIPLMPFYWTALAILYSTWKRDRSKASLTEE